jgi:hypothetical protein
MNSSTRGSAFWVFIFGVAFGAALGAVLMHKYLTEYGGRAAEAAAPASPDVPGTTQPAPGATEDAFARILREWHLTPEDVRRQLSNAGQVIRREGTALGARVDEATLDARIVTVIKAKYTLDRALSAWDIAVTSTDGRVTLSGTVNQPDLVVRAVVLALDTSGVTEVQSALRVKSAATPTLPPVES